jgi:hypothetical protein
MDSMDFFHEIYLNETERLLDLSSSVSDLGVSVHLKLFHISTHNPPGAQNSGMTSLI